MIRIWQRFKLPEPPQGADPVWRIESPDRPGRPLSINLSGVGKARMLGWMAPILGSAEPEAHRPAFYLNGESCDSYSGALLPDNAPEVYGTITVLTRKRPLSEPDIDRLCAEVRFQMGDTIQRWLEETAAAKPHLLRLILEGALPASKRLRGVCLEDPFWQDAVRRWLRFPTNSGPKTFEELGDGGWIATATLHPRHIPLIFPVSDRIVLDMRDAGHLAVFKRLSGHDKIIFADVAAARARSARESLGDRELTLKRWFEAGFREAGSRYRGVRVRIETARRPAYWTALVGPSGHTSNFRQWVETSVLYLNAESELAASILSLPDDNSAEQYIPRIVHNHALLFSIADFSHEWETQLWGDVRELVELFRRSADLEGQSRVEPAPANRFI